MTTSLYPDQILKRRVLAWAQRLKVNPQQVEIREMPRKWGSCSSDGIVTFSDDLPFEDSDFQDFVVVHELLHLRYKTHGKGFQAVMSALVPEWRALEARARDRDLRRSGGSC